MLSFFLVPMASPCSIIWTRSASCVAAGAHAVLALDKAGWHTTRKLQVPGKHQPLAPAAREPGTEPD